MKILHIITELDIGGAENQLLLLLPLLHNPASTTHEVICLSGQGPIAKTLQKQNITVHFINAKSPFDIGALMRLIRRIKSSNPNCIIGYLFVADIFTRLAATLTGTPYISSQRSSLVGKEKFRYIDYATSRLVNAYIVQTSAAQKDLEKHTAKPIHIIPNAVRIPQQITKHNQDTPVITCVASLKPGKGHKTLIQAFNSIHAQFPSAKLHLIGDGPLKKELQAYAQVTGSAHCIQFLGHRDDVPKCLTNTTIFALPTFGEGMSNALLEAMAFAIPCVTTDIPANRAIIEHNLTGILVPPNDPNALAKALTRLLSNPDLRTTIGSNARTYVQRNHNPAQIALVIQNTIAQYAA